MNVARRLENISVLDADGRGVRLGDLWREQTVVLAFIRHFGWLFCRQQVAVRNNSAWPLLQSD